jgi:hypothetical protein
VSDSSPDRNISLPPSQTEGPVFLRRRRRPRTPISLAEKFLLFGLSLQIFWMTWGFGVMIVPARITLLSLTIFTFLLLFLPRPERPGLGQTSHILKRFLQSPVFWVGVLFLGYILIQNLNVALVYQFEDLGAGRRRWWMMPVDHITWLPHGVSVPFERGNGWRALMMIGGAFLFALTIYTGIDRRRSLHYLLWFIFLNGLALGVFATIQKGLEAPAIYWFYPAASGDGFYGSFVYRNFASAYLYLTMGAGCALFFILRQQSLSSFSKSGPHLLILALIFVLYGCTAYSFSRGGVIASTGLILTFLLVWFVLAFAKSTVREKAFLGGGFVLLAGGITILTLMLPFREALEERFAPVFASDQVDGSRLARQLIGDVVWQGVENRAPLGYGAGSFYYVFSFYLLERPELTMRGRNRARWIFAHNDWLQYQFEFGFIGSGLALATALAWLFPMLYRYRGFSGASFILIVSFLALLGHAIMDFMLQNPAILALGAGLLALAARKVEVEAPRFTNPPTKSL